MTTIRHFPFLSHATSTPTRFLLAAHAGKTKPRGAGASFWFRPLGTTIAEVPIDDLEFGTIFPVTTVDHQEVTVQTALTVRITDPEAAAQRTDFSVELASGQWAGRPTQLMNDRVAELARQYAAGAAAVQTLAQILKDGLVTIRDAISSGLGSEQQLSDAGLAIVGVRVIAIRPDAELERALQNRVREAVQTEADRATYERRAQAVDQERAIKENELNNRTELARREAELVELDGANERRRTEQELERDRMRSRTALENKKLNVDARVDEIDRIATAENVALAKRLEEYSGASGTAVLAAIAPEVLASLPTIDSLTVTPDMLAGAIKSVMAELARS